MTQDMAYAFSGLALHWQCFDMRGAILVRFDCLLRTGELLQLSVADIMTNDQLTFATIILPDTRDEEHGITDSMSVTNAPLIRLLARFIQTKQPGSSVIVQLPQAVRRSLRQLLDDPSLNNLKPYSMRRGRATNLFRAAN